MGHLNLVFVANRVDKCKLEEGEEVVEVVEVVAGVPS
jgi:hypothetical protein